MENLTGYTAFGVAFILLTLFGWLTGNSTNIGSVLFGIVVGLLLINRDNKRKQKDTVPQSTITIGLIVPLAVIAISYFIKSTNVWLWFVIGIATFIFLGFAIWGIIRFFQNQKQPINP